MYFTKKIETMTQIIMILEAPLNLDAAILDTARALA
jgi:hypothetical protein